MPNAFGLSGCSHGHLPRISCYGSEHAGEAYSPEGEEGDQEDATESEEGGEADGQYSYNERDSGNVCRN